VTPVEDQNAIQISKSVLYLEHIVGQGPDDIELDYVTPWKARSHNDRCCVDNGIRYLEFSRPPIWYSKGPSVDNGNVFEFDGADLRSQSENPDVIIRNSSVFEVFQGVVGHGARGNRGNIDTIELIRSILMVLLLKVQIKRLSQPR
jgi:hypothetical protein